MPVPDALRRTPPPRTLAWAATRFGAGARVVRCRRLRNAWAAAMHALDIVDRRGNRHRLVLRRWARVDLPPDPGVVAHEAAALTLLASTRLPAPRLVAFDAAGDDTDSPALLMTRVAGRGELAPADLDHYLAQLAATLRAVHALPPPAGTLGRFRPWGLAAPRVPRWARRPARWRRAIELAREPVPAHVPVFVHRDFHPGNVLWRRGQITGVVDWTHSCAGPAAADLAHCRANLALLFGTDAADVFAREYGAVEHLAWHDIADVVGMCDADVELWRWHDAGRPDLTVEQCTDALETFLEVALSRVT
jgi:aminoglycoside phosphotransferase (APT) family kinase protein